MNEPTFDINWDSHVDHIEERTQRHYTCGEYRRSVDQHTGKITWVRWFCKKYHTCLTCKAHKQKTLTDQLTPFLNDPNIRVIAHSDDIKEYNDTYPERLHIPKGEGEYLSIVRTDDTSIGQPLTREMLAEISNCAVAPKGKRISGNLGKSASVSSKKQETDFPDEITRRVFKYCDSEGNNCEDKKVISQIERETEKETSDLDPKDCYQVQDAIYVREQKLIEVAKKYNIEILFLYTETIIVYANRINWQKDKNAPIRPPVPTPNV